MVDGCEQRLSDDLFAPAPKELGDSRFPTDLDSSNQRFEGTTVRKNFRSDSKLVCRLPHGALQPLQQARELARIQRSRWCFRLLLRRQIGRPGDDFEQRDRVRARLTG